MKKILTTFSGSKYHEWTKLIVENGARFGCDVKVYDDHWLTYRHPEFVERTRWAFNDPKRRGVNWFAFKPFTILDALSKANDGDIILFTDADTYPIHSLDAIYDQCEKDGGMMLFAANGHLQRQWCKRDCMALMDMDADVYRDKPHAVARFMLFQKGSKFTFGPTEFYPNGGTVTPEEFLTAWLDYCCDQRLNTFEKSVVFPEYADLNQHRCEQAILTNLAHRYGMKLYREACEYGNTFEGDWNLYPQIFVQNGSHSYDPEGHRDGSKFRNVE